MIELTLKTLSDQKRAIIWWSLGLFTYAILIVITYPSTKEIDFEPLEQNLQFFLGGADTLSTLEGYLTSQIFYLPLALGIYAVFMSVRLVTIEINSGGMDFLLSHPLARYQVVLGKYLTLVAIIFGLSLVFGASLYVAGTMIDDELALTAALLAGLNLIPIVLFYGTVGFCAACLTLGRQAVLGIGSAVAVSTWVLHGLAVSSELLSKIEKWTVFHW